MKKTSTQKTRDAVSLLLQGHSYSKVAARLSISKATVHRIKKLHLPGGGRAQAGRPRLLGAQQVRHIVRKATSGQLDTAVEVKKSMLEQQQIQLSADTVRRALKRSGLRSAAKVKKPLLKARHIRDRLAFAGKYKHWTVADWMRVIWSDETKINRFGSDGRKWCWKEPGSALKPSHVVGTLKHGGGSIMVWGCMTAEGPGFLTKIDGGLDAELYCRILEGELQDTIEWYGMERDKVVFQHDNDPKHTARRTKEWIERNKLRVLDWPAQSPDLNPIEHLWEHLKRRLEDYESVPSGVHELWERVQVEWEKISKEECMHLIESMPRRLAAVLKAKGSYSKY
jgi:transposase